MKKIFFFAVLAAAFTFAACGNEEATEEQPMEDTVVVAEEPVVDTMVVDTPVVEEPVATPVKKAKVTKNEEPKSVEPVQLKKPVSSPAAKRLDPATDKPALRISKEKPVTDNGNVISNDASKAEGQKEIGTKKKGLSAN